MRMILVIGVLTMIALPHGRTTAQAQKFDALSLPKPGLLACRVIVPRKADSAAVVVTFSDESESFQSREMTAAFDSLGNPLALLVFATKQLGDSSYGESYILRLRAPIRGVHVSAIGKLPPGTSTTGPMPTPLSTETAKAPATEEDIHLARQLLKWAWDHRCHPVPVDM